MADSLPGFWELYTDYRLHHRDASSSRLKRVRADANRRYKQHINDGNRQAWTAAHAESRAVSDILKQREEAPIA